MATKNDDLCATGQPGPTGDNPDRLRVAVVGLGAIGFPMAHRLSEAGHDVIGIDPVAAARERAEAVGMTSAADVADTKGCDVVLMLVATGSQAKDVAAAAARHRGSLQGETWVLVSTIGPTDARAAQVSLASVGASVVDAPVTGGVPGAEQGRLRFFTAGPQDAIDRLAGVFEILGEVLLVGGTVGDGQSMKLVNQLCSSTHLVVAAEAIALATSFGLDPVRAVELISGGSGASWFFDDRGPRMAGGAPDVLTRLAILAKDNALVTSLAAEAGASVPMLETARRRYQEAEAMGLLNEDDSQIIRTYDPSN
jgi:3-hydroxyisobutyrate dehydrogenase